VRGWLFSDVCGGIGGGPCAIGMGRAIRERGGPEGSVSGVLPRPRHRGCGAPGNRRSSKDPGPRTEAGSARERIAKYPFSHKATKARRGKGAENRTKDAEAREASKKGGNGAALRDRTKRRLAVKERADSDGEKVAREAAKGAKKEWRSFFRVFA